MRAEPCVCGGVVASSSADFGTVAVQLHNQSACHQIWRAVREGRLSPEGTTTVVTDDLSRLFDDASSPLLRIGSSSARSH